MNGQVIPAGIAYTDFDHFAARHGDRYGNISSTRDVWASDAATRLGAINQPLTTLVLGTPMIQAMPSDLIMRAVPVTGATFEWARYDQTHLGYRDTKRELRGKIPRVSSGGSTQTGSVQFRALASEADRLELPISMAGGGLLRQAAQPIQLPRFLVALDQELEKRDLLLAASSYVAAQDRTLAAPDQWDSGTSGKVFDSVIDLANDVARAASMPRGVIDVVMSDSAWQAAQKDPELRQLPGATSVAQGAFNEEQLRQFLRIRSLSVFNDPEIDLGSGLERMYGDVCFVFVNPLLTGAINGVDTTYGSELWAADFRWTAGVVGSPWFDNDTNSDVWPWHAANRPLITSTVAGGILRDVSAAV